MDNYILSTLDTTVDICTDNNPVVDEALQIKMMNAETDEQVIELSIEKLFQSLQEAIKM